MLGGWVGIGRILQRVALSRDRPLGMLIQSICVYHVGERGLGSAHRRPRVPPCLQRRDGPPKTLGRSLYHGPPGLDAQTSAPDCQLMAVPHGGTPIAVAISTRISLALAFPVSVS